MTDPKRKVNQVRALAAQILAARDALLRGTIYRMEELEREAGGRSDRRNVDDMQGYRQWAGPARACPKVKNF